MYIFLFIHRNKTKKNLFNITYTQKKKKKIRFFLLLFFTFKNLIFIKMLQNKDRSKVVVIIFCKQI